MQRRIEASRAALADLDGIYDYIAKENPRAAAELLRELDHSIQLLTDQPKLGRAYSYRRLIRRCGRNIVITRSTPKTASRVSIARG